MKRQMLGKGKFFQEENLTLPFAVALKREA
jgi:hypothetical protein